MRVNLRPGRWTVSTGKLPAWAGLELEGAQAVKKAEGLGCDPVDRAFSAEADLTPKWGKTASWRKNVVILFLCIKHRYTYMVNL